METTQVLHSEVALPRAGVPKFGAVTPALLLQALALGWSDLRRAPQFGLVFSGIYVAFGWFLLWVTVQTETSYWLVLAVFGFPLIGPFVAVGLYEVSRRLQKNEPLDWSSVMGVVLLQRQRSLPMIGAITIVIFLFWFFLGHMIFALFLGLSPMTNILTSSSVFLTVNGLTMLTVGTVVGGIFALFLYMITVLSLPMVLDREVDFVSAMAGSFVYVAAHPVKMLGWAAFIALATLVSLAPLFLGLLIVLPLLGHATWHLYYLLASHAPGADPQVHARQ